MKRYSIILFLILAIAGALAQVIKGTGQFSKTNASTTVPVVFTNATLQVMEVTILGKSAPRTDNVGDIYVGTTSGNDTQAFKIAPGGEASIKVTSGYIDLASWYVDVTTANDGVTVIYR